MNPEQRQEIIARAQRERSEAMAALVAAGARWVWAQVLRLRRAGVRVRNAPSARSRNAPGARSIRERQVQP
jgi:hypothetical protein